MSILLGLHITHMTAAGFSPHTTHARQRVLETADRELPYGIDVATTTELTNFMAKPNWAPWTRCTYRRHIAGFYRWAAAGDDPYISFDPSLEVPQPRTPEFVPHPATDEQLTAALERSNWRWQRAVTLAAYAGLRAAEIAAIKREHITQDTISIWQGKGNRDAILPCHPSIWKMARDLPPGLVIPNPSGKPMRFGGTSSAHFRRIGLPGLHIHMFRHWYATSMLRAGVDLRTLQLLMRHKNLETTAAYLLVEDEQRRFAVSTLPVLSSSPLQEAA